MSKEIWKDIKGYEGVYQVSNLGRVKSFAQVVSIDRKLGAFTREFKGRVLKCKTSKRGYNYVNLYKFKKSKTWSVHQLVAIAFLNHTPNGRQDIVVDHVNDIKNDNRLENLQLISQRDNVIKEKKKHFRSSEFTGVYYSKIKKRWRSTFSVGKVSTSLGNFKTEIEASDSYKLALFVYEGNKTEFNTKIINKEHKLRREYLQP